MIEIIIQPVDMPHSSKRRYQVEHKNNKWSIMDTELNKLRYKGSYEDVVLRCHNLNKKYYLANK